MLRWVRSLLAGGFAGRPDTAPAALRQRLDGQLRAAGGRREAGDPGGAESLCRAILEEDPDHAHALYLLGEIAALRGHNDEAAGLIRRAISIEDGEPRFHYALGCVLGAAGDARGAEESYRKAIVLSPGHASARVNLGCLLQARGEAEAGAPGRAGEGAERDLEAAAAQFTAAAEAAPDFPDAWINLGYARAQQRRLADAQRCYDRALAIDPELAHARFNRAMVLLGQGRLIEGWDDYEWRWQASGFPRPAPPPPEWDGSSLEGKTILLYTEQGFGDAIQFIRYAKPVAALGARVIVRCPPELQALFRGAPGVAQAVTPAEPAPAFDVQCALLGLPRLLRTSADTIPAEVPYLCAAGAGLGDARPGLKVGLVWASQSLFPGAAQKSVPLAALAALHGVPGVNFYSLQAGEAGRQAFGSAAPIAMRDLASGLKNFADTAAFIAGLDLTISVDTAVAHLAGAMGKPVWTLLPYAADWRWEPDGERNRWYPSMRLFRQRRRGDWAEVLQRVAAALRRAAGGAMLPT